MNRRLFTQLLFTSPFTIPVWASAVMPTKTTSTLIQTSPIAGFQYYAGKNLWKRFQKGQALSMLREPTNPHDNRAVALFWEGYKIGYLPRDENLAISQMLDRQIPLQARIAGLRESNDPWQRINIEIAIG